MSKYSTSQVQTYVQCPLKYRYHYVDKIPVPEFVETADTLLWSLVHETLEKLYDDVNVLKTPSKEDLIKFYYDLWAEKEKEAKENWWEIQVINKEFTLDDYKRRGESYLIKYYDKHSPFEDIKVIDTEMQIMFKLDDDINFQWFIDRLDKVWDTFVISDYKTNKRLPTEEKDWYIEQLTLYGIWIKQKYAKYFKDMKARLYFLHFDIEDERDLTVERMEQVRQKYIGLIREIEEKKKKYWLGDKKCFESKQSPLCQWCDYFSICPLFNAINTDDEVVSDLSDKTLSSLVDEFISLSNQTLDIKKQKDWLKDIFQKYVQSKDPNNEQSDFLIAGSTWNIRVSKKAKISILDKDKFMEKVKELWLFDSYADIPWHNVDKLFLEDWSATVEDFLWAVSEDVRFDFRKVSKKAKDLEWNVLM